ncbi:MAG: hypothetical protein O7D86_05090 [Proteobacteria bacterium]|nr:hypothetical protein [Pseudomonadota bacterium]
MLDTFNAGDIVLGNAYYGSYILLTEHIARNIDVVFEQHGARKRTQDFRTGKQRGKKDHLIVYKKPKIKPDWISQEKYDAIPEILTVRECKVGGKTFSNNNVIT